MNLTGIFYGDSRAFEFQSAVKQLKDSEKINLNIFCFDVIKVNSDKQTFQKMCNKLKESDAVIIHFHGSSAHLQNLETVIGIINGKKIFFDCSIPEEISSIMLHSSLTPEEYIKLKNYFKAGGIDQIIEFVKLFSNITAGTNYILQPPKQRKAIGIYKDGKQLDEDEEQKLLLDISNSKKNIIGVVAHYPFLINQNMRHVDIEKVLKMGEKVLQKGILAEADGNILYADEINLLEDYIVDLLLDAAAMGVNTIERDGISYSHSSKFILIGTMNPEEGELRPQLLDRFGLLVDVKSEKDGLLRKEIIKKRLAFENNPEEFINSSYNEEKNLILKIKEAQKRVPHVKAEDEILDLVVSLSTSLNVDGHRGDLTLVRAAKAYAAFQERDEVTKEDIIRLAQMVYSHRLRKKPFEEINPLNRSDIENILNERL